MIISPYVLTSKVTNLEEHILLVKSMFSVGLFILCIPRRESFEKSGPGVENSFIIPAMGLKRCEMCKILNILRKFIEVLYL